MRDPKRVLQVCGLFSGSGGIELGLRHAGHRVDMLSEIDPHAVSVLRRGFPEVEIRGDVRALKRLKSVDLLVAGFPCQDLSQVGPRIGIRGRRSGLVEEVFRLLREQLVEWVLLENVPFMLNLGEGAGMRWLLSQLESLGYRWAYRVIDSRAFGVPQRRKRVYVLASQSGDPRAVLLEPDRGPGEELANSGVTSFGFYWTEGNRGIGWAVDAIPTLKGGSGVGIPSPPAIIRASGSIIVPDIRDAERLQGFPRNWTRPAECEGGRAGARWRLVGNAVTVDVAEWIGERLARDLRSYTERGDRDQVLSAHRRGMPAAAWSLGQGRWVEACVSSWPVRRGSSLEQFLSYEGRPLSFKAAKGFYERLLRSPLRRPEPLVLALERHIALHEK